MDASEEALREATALIKSLLLEECSLKELEHDYIRHAEKPIPFREYNYICAEDFLEQEIGCSLRKDVRGIIMVSCRSEKSSHIAKLVEHQKPSSGKGMGRGKLRPTAASSTNFRSTLRETRPNSQGFSFNGSSLYGGYDVRDASTSRPYTAGSTAPFGGYPVAPKYREFHTDEELWEYCNRHYPPAFQKVLQSKMQRFVARGVTPDDFIRFFDESTEFETGRKKPLDFGNLRPLDFFKGLPAVFDVIFKEDTPLLFVPVISPILSRESPATREPAPQPQYADQPKLKLPAATDVILVLSKVNKDLAGSEVSLYDYFEFLKQHHGNLPIEFLRLRHQTDEKIMQFIANNANLQSPVEVTSSGRLRISGSGKKSDEGNSERHNTTYTAAANASTYSNNPINPMTTPTYTYLSEVPYSSAFKHEFLSDGDDVHAGVSLFSSGPELRFCFTTMEETRLRDKLLARLNSDSVGRQAPRPLRIYQGMPCLAPDNAPRNLYQRAVVISETNSQLGLYFVDTGIMAKAHIEDIREIPTTFLAESVYSHPAVVGLVKPIQGELEFKIHIAQRLSVHEGDVVQMRILSHCKQHHTVDLEVLVMPIIQDGLIERDTSRNGVKNSRGDETRNVSYSVKVEMLPTMNNFYVVTRNDNGESEVLVPTACLSDLFGLGGDTLLAKLESAACIMVSRTRKVPRDTSGELYRELSRGHCPNLSVGQEITLIPIEAVVPLLKAYEGAFHSKDVQSTVKLTIQSIREFHANVSSNHHK